MAMASGRQDAPLYSLQGNGQGFREHLGSPRASFREAERLSHRLMPKLDTVLMIYDPVTRTQRARKVKVGGPELPIDCVERDNSCLDLQMLGEAADGAPSCKVTFEVTIELIKRRRGFR